MTQTELTRLVGRSPARLGAVFALATLPVHLVLTPAASHHLAAVVLGVVAGIYVGFALQDGRARMLAVEAAVALLFVAAALAGLWVSAWLIPAAYLAHGLWDFAHHRHVTTAMPRWYVPLCAVYDWIFATGLMTIWALR